MRSRFIGSTAGAVDYLFSDGIGYVTIGYLQDLQDFGQPVVDFVRIISTVVFR